MQVSVSLDDPTSAHAAAAAIAGQLRRHYRSGAETRSPRDELRRLHQRMSTASVPETFLQGLHALPEAAGAVLASHVRLHEAIALPSGITQQIVNRTLERQAGHLQVTYSMGSEHARSAREPGGDAGSRSNLLRAVLPCLQAGGMYGLSLPHRLPGEVVSDFISSGVLSQPSLHSLQLCTAQLPLPAIAEIVSRATALTGLALTEVDTEAQAAEQHLPSLQGLYTADPSPGRQDPYTSLDRCSSRPIGPAVEPQADQVAVAISQLQQLKSLQLRPPLSLSSSFWQHLGQQAGISSLDLAFLPPPPAGMQPALETDAQSVFQALPLFSALAELQLHGRDLSREAEEVRPCSHLST